MDLYDDIDAKPKAAQIDGWSSSIKMLQTQLAVKKALLPKDPPKKPLLPAVGLKSKKWPSQSEGGKTATDVKSVKTGNASPSSVTSTTTKTLVIPSLTDLKTEDWEFQDEYDPAWPNEYEKLKDKIQMAKEKEHHRSRREDRSSDRKRGRHRNHHNSPSNSRMSGFGHRASEEDNYSPPVSGSVSSKGGVAIAPPPSLQEISIANDNGDSSSNVTIPYSASSVAAKIMAKYGFKDGQGLGKQQQGMSVALQVEKTSKRGGRIIHEKDALMPPPPTVPLAHGSTMPPPQGIMPPPAAPKSPATTSTSSPPASESVAANMEPSITEIMKEPSKVVLLKNMVGPGDVDEDLEPEVKDECNSKYGEVVKVLIHEAFGTAPDEAVKIFLEFKRIESAIKAVVDLNGRFFGGRQVRASFYNYDKFKNFQLN